MRRVLLMSSAYLASGIALIQASAGNGWTWDDLALIRRYRAAELAGAWTGTWDPDGINTPGYRPLATLFSHLRFMLLGEHPQLYRILSVVLVALAFTLLAEALARFGIPSWASFAAGMVTLTAANFSYTLSWVSDGYNALQLLLFACVVFAVGRRWLVAALVGWVVLMLVKDQAVVLLPIVLGLLVDVRARRLSLGLFVAVTVALVALRQVFVPEASGLDLHPRSYLTQLRDVADLAGTGSAAYVLMALAAVVTLVCSRRSAVRTVGLLSGASALVAAGFGLTVQRQDLVYLPLYFYALLLGCAGYLALQRRRTLAVIAVGALATVSLTASIRQTVAIQHSMQPLAADNLAFDYDMVYGADAHATIPPGRRSAVVTRLGSVGLHGPRGSYSDVYRLLYCRPGVVRTTPFLDAVGAAPICGFGGRPARRALPPRCSAPAPPRN